MDLKITSSNIRFENPKDGDHDWPNRRDLLSDIIKNFDSDLLGTQEGREPQLRNFESLLPGYKLIAPHREWISERMYPCIFIKPEKFNVLKTGDIWLSKTPEVAGSKSFDSAFPRLSTWMHGRDIESQNEFLFVVTHLDHTKQSVRIEQAKVLVKEIDKIKGSLPIILVGDFNDSPSSPVRKILNQLDLKDHWILKDQDEESSHHQFTGKNHDGSRIDWILVSSSFECENIFLDKTNLNGVYPSDHFPLNAKLNLTC